MSNRYDPTTGFPLDAAPSTVGTDMPFPAPGHLPFGMPVASTGFQQPPVEPQPAPYAHQPIPFEELLEEPQVSDEDHPAPQYELPPQQGLRYEDHPELLEEQVRHEQVDHDVAAHEVDAHDEAVHDETALVEPSPPLVAPFMHLAPVASPAPFDPDPAPARSPATLLRVLAPAVAFGAVVAHFVLVRWVDGWWWDTLVVGLFVAALATAGALSVRHGAAAAYMAAALALPFALGASGNLALDLRLRALSSVDVPAASAADDASGQGASDADPIEAAVAQAVPLGTTATVHGFEVKLVESTCGLAVIPNGLPGKNYLVKGSKNQYADARPADGQEFCVLTSSWANTTSAPLMSLRTESIDQVRTADGTTYAPTEQDADIERVVNAGRPVGDVNPGATITHHSVVSVPRGSSAQHGLAQGVGTTQETWPAVIAFALN